MLVLVVGFSEKLCVVDDRREKGEEDKLQDGRLWKGVCWENEQNEANEARSIGGP